MSFYAVIFAPLGNISKRVIKWLNSGSRLGNIIKGACVLALVWYVSTYLAWCVGAFALYFPKTCGYVILSLLILPFIVSVVFLSVRLSLKPLVLKMGLVFSVLLIIVTFELWVFWVNLGSIDNKSETRFFPKTLQFPLASPKYIAVDQEENLYL